MKNWIHQRDRHAQSFPQVQDIMGCICRILCNIALKRGDIGKKLPQKLDSTHGALPRDAHENQRVAGNINSHFLRSPSWHAKKTHDLQFFDQLLHRIAQPIPNIILHLRKALGLTIAKVYAILHVFCIFALYFCILQKVYFSLLLAKFD